MVNAGEEAITQLTLDEQVSVFSPSLFQFSVRIKESGCVEWVSSVSGVWLWHATVCREDRSPASVVFHACGYIAFEPLTCGITMVLDSIS